MKRVLLVLGLILLLTVGLSAQTYDQFGEALQTFTDEVANTLPATAAMAGLSWSPAYIGQFPHFGAGLSVGASTIPSKVIDPLVTDLGIDLPSEFDYFEKWGVPIPAIALDARLGGIIFPFDVGVKFGFIPDQLREKMGKINADYLLVGGDVRVPLLKGRGLLPALSVSGGYTFMKGNIGVPDIGTPSYVIDLDPYIVGETLTIDSPELTFTWNTHAFVGKIQASKKLLIFTPHLGLGAAYGVSEAGGGMSSTVTYSGGTLDEATIQAIEAALADAGYGDVSLSGTDFLVTSEANGYSFWLYGGTAINILFIKLDLSATYNLVSGSLGGAVNVRVQF